MTGPRPRCGFRWLTETHGGPRPGYDAVTEWHVCVRPPGTHVQADGTPPLHMCAEGHTTPQEAAA
jgi:hypothetical protein